ncbi:MAG: GNAT family N-acetyltransferase [Myxococcaceae bacterium]
MLTVREMSAVDLPKVAELSKQLGYPVTAEALQKRFDALRFSKTHVLFVAGDPVGGWIQVEERQSLESGENAEIVGLVVDSARRREGLGRALVARAEQWAKERGLPKLRVRSNVTREESHRFYPALGFKTSKTQHVYEKPLP